MPLLLPVSSDECFSIGHQLRLAGRAEMALLAFSRAHELNPGNRDAAQAVATLADGLNLPRRGIATLLRTLDCAGDEPDCLAMLASLHLRQEQYESALACCDRSLRLKVGHKVALWNRGVALRRMGRVSDAFDNDRRLVHSYAGSAEAWQRYADACLMVGQYDAALLATERSLALADLATTHLTRGLALAMLERFEAADAEFVLVAGQGTGPDRQPPLLPPLDARGVFLARWLEHLANGDWSHREPLLAMLRREFPPGHGRRLPDTSVAFNILALPLRPAEQRSVAQAVARGVVARAPRRALPLRPACNGRLRIGYLCADYRPHPVLENIWRTFLLHDRQRFEIFAYALTPEDGSPQRGRVKQYADHFVDLSSLTDAEAVDRMALDGLHIVVDRSCYTDFTRPQILAARVAPIQVQDMGMASASGADFVDYRFSDRFVAPPGAEADWDEALVYLPDTVFLCDDTVVVPPAPSRVECGLPEDAFVYCCFNNHFKIEPDVFAVWMRLLGMIPDAVLWLVDASGESTNRLRREAARQGVDPERLVFAPRWPMDRHLARHACADLFLDTFYYGAHTTAVDALRAGLPVLTRAGDTMASRIGGSLLNAVGLPELVTTTTRDYETAALRLALKGDELSRLRHRLQETGAGSALFNTPRRIRDMERAFEMMWQRFVKGEPPASFDVPMEIP